MELSLTLTKGPKSQLNQIFLLYPNKEYLIGRSILCEIQINDPLISTLHCYIKYDNNKFKIYDLLSVNGVKINKKLIFISELKTKDIIEIGKSILEVDLKSDENLEKKDEENKREELIAKEPLGRKINDNDINICRLALKKGKLNYNQIENIIKIQKDNAEKGILLTLKEIIIKNNFLTQEETEQLLKEYKFYKIRNRDIRYGRIAIQEKIVPKEKIDEAFQLQEIHFKETGNIPRIGEILVEKNYITIHQNNKIIRLLNKLKEEENI